MLVLERKEGQEIVIDGQIRVKLLQVWPSGRVIVGVEAPKHIAVHRAEVQDKINKRET